MLIASLVAVSTHKAATRPLHMLKRSESRVKACNVYAAGLTCMPACRLLPPSAWLPGCAARLPGWLAGGTFM